MDFFDEHNNEQANARAQVSEAYRQETVKLFKRNIYISVIGIVMIFVIIFSVIFGVVLSDAVEKVQTEGQKLLDGINKEYYLPVNVEMLSKDVFESCKNSAVELFCTGQALSGTASSATGIILNSDGYVLTNAHVILYEYSYKSSSFGIPSTETRTAEYSSIKANFANSTTKYDLKIIAYDVDLDLAILRFINKPNGLAPIKISKSAYLNYGEKAIVIGNAENFGLSVTEGIISNPSVSIGGKYNSVMTNAAVNPGNSGGPLFNVYGEMMGVISSKIASEENEGLGFAIPTETVLSYVDKIASSKKLTIGYTLSYRGEAISK